MAARDTMPWPARIELPVAFFHETTPGIPVDERGYLVERRWYVVRGDFLLLSTILAPWLNQ